MNLNSFKESQKMFVINIFIVCLALTFQIANSNPLTNQFDLQKSQCTREIDNVCAYNSYRFDWFTGSTCICSGNLNQLINIFGMQDYDTLEESYCKEDMGRICHGKSHKVTYKLLVSTFCICTGMKSPL